MAVTQLTPDNFESEVKQSDIPVLVDFWAPWCESCKMMGPVFEELSGEYEGKVKFTKLNTEEYPQLAGQFGIQGIPTLLVMKGGGEIDRLVGFAPKDQLKQKIDDAVSKA